MRPMQNGDIVKYPDTATVGKVVDIIEKDGRVWAKLDFTGLYYAVDTLIPADKSEYHDTQFKDLTKKNEGFENVDAVRRIREMEENVDISEMEPTGGG